MIYSIVTAVCVLDVFSARRKQRATFAFAYRQVTGRKEDSGVRRLLDEGLKPGRKRGARGSQTLICRGRNFREEQARGCHERRAQE